MEDLQSRKAAARATTVALSVACASLLLVAAVEGQYSDWGAAADLAPPVNSAFAELAPSISTDGLSLYFFSDRPGGFGGNDIWVSQRASVADPWDAPQNLGPTINTVHDDNAPTLTLDGHRLYFASNRPEGFGGLDLYVSRRHNKRDDFAWQPPENLGSGINTAANEAAPAPFEDDVTGAITLYFHSNRPGGIGADDIYASTLNLDESFGPAIVVEELSSPFLDRLPGIRRDGLEAFITSNRPGGFGLLDVWVSTRASTSNPWSIPVNLGPAINSAAADGRAVLTFDGTYLYFHSQRFGTFDLFVATRSKLKDPD
jgi:Tol biopolymer transport system component